LLGKTLVMAPPRSWDGDYGIMLNGILEKCGM